MIINRAENPEVDWQGANENENLPPGFRAKLKLKLESETELYEKCEFASPGKDYGMCIINHWQKRID